MVDVSGGVEFLQAAGFQLVFEEDAETRTTEGCDSLAPPLLLYPVVNLCPLVCA